jgi:hypothetical protein
MPISVPLNKKTVSLLEETAKLFHISKSEVIKHSLSDYCSKILEEKHRQPYELIKDFLGKGGSGMGDLSVRGEEILRDFFKRKN